MKMLLSVIVAVTGILFATPGHAAWQGPTEIVSGTWGISVGQFGFTSGDPLDSFPRYFLVDKLGNVVIADSLNKRIQVFKVNGEKIAFGYKNINVQWDILEWPNEGSMVNFGTTIVVEGPGGFQYYDYQGSLINQFEVSDCYLRGVNEDGSVILLCKKNIYYKYSSSGKLLETFSGKPLALGLIEEEHLGDLNYKTTVKYGDATYTITAKKTYEQFSRDTKGSLYAISGLEVERYNKCGKLTAKLIPPSNLEFYGDKVPGQEQYIFTHDEYGDAVIDVNGNVYAWKRSPKKYSILKWTWVDDPNVPTGPDAPSGLAVTPSIDGLYLTWTASPNDPGCVTKYEIARATTSGGVFSTVGTVEKGILKYNDTSAEVGTQYYYKVRAMAGSDPSLYTGEASGKR